jgi:predicted Zn-dependent protease
MLLRGVDQPQGQNIQEIARDSMETAGFRITEGEAATISGLDAYLGVYHGQIEGLGAVAMRAAYIRNDGQIYLVAGIVPPDGFGQADGAFLASIRSFRRLSAAEAEGIRPNRVDMYVVRTGDTWQSIAERSGGVVAPETLAIMNQATLATQPQLGARIKIVVGG